MILESAALIVSGFACLSLACFAMYTAMPREGKPPSVLAKTEMRSTFLALTLVTLMIMGIGLMVKGIFA